MVRDSLWTKAKMQLDGGYLCIGCLEKRIGRTLRRSDFPPFPVNDPVDPWKTERLRNRLFGLGPTADEVMAGLQWAIDKFGKNAVNKMIADSAEEQLRKSAERKRRRRV